MYTSKDAGIVVVASIRMIYHIIAKNFCGIKFFINVVKVALSTILSTIKCSKWCT